MRRSEHDGAVPLLRFDTPEDPLEHEELVRKVARLAMLELGAVRCATRGNGVAVTIEVGSRRRTILHPKNTLDLDRMIQSIEALMIEEPARRYYALEREGLAEDHAIAFATETELRRLIDRGWRVALNLETSSEISVVEGIRVRGDVERWDDGSLKKIVLAQDANVRGFRCAADTTVRFVDGGLCDATLGPPMQLADCTLPAKTRVFFHYHSSVIGIARLASSTEICGLVVPANSELEFDERGRLIAATLGASTTPPSGYRDRGALGEGTVVELADGKWSIATQERASRVGGPRTPRKRTPSGALLGWTLLVAFVGAPFALLAGLSWLSSKGIGERCARHDECHSVLGDRCVEGVCALSCDTEDECPSGWSCEPALGGGSACVAPDLPHFDALTQPW